MDYRGRDSSPERNDTDHMIYLPAKQNHKTTLTLTIYIFIDFPFPAFYSILSLLCMAFNAGHITG